MNDVIHKVLIVCSLDCGCDLVREPLILKGVLDDSILGADLGLVIDKDSLWF